MKVRPTGYHSTHIDVEEESPSYYITRDGELLSKKGYEPVPEEQWVDVTDECEVDSQGEDITHKGKYLYAYNGYRLRKVSAWSSGFIVEKRTT